MEHPDQSEAAKAARMNDPAMVAIRKQQEEEEKEYEKSKRAADVGFTENTQIAEDELHLNLDMGVPTAPISSLCINCEEQGETKFMMTHIPFFKEIMISAFSCDHCGYKNSEVTFCGRLEDYGCRYEVNVINDVAFNRQIVKSEFATIRVPEAGLEMPPATQKGSIKTMEGYFMTTIEGLQEVQEQRRLIDPATAQKIDEYCDTLREFAEGKRFPFTFIVEDPSGNSYVQNPSAPTADQYCKRTQWIRTIDDYSIMGYPVDQATLQAEDDKLRLKEANQGGKNSNYHDYISRDTSVKAQTKQEQDKLITKLQTYSERDVGTSTAVVEAGYVDFSRSVEDQGARDALDDDDVRKNVQKFPVPCYNCDKMGNVQMCYSSIPFFKEIILMCFCCDFCGYRNSEIKEGGGMGDKGKKIILDVKEPADLNRDIFKSNTARFQIPQIGFDMEPGSLGSCFTTVEGLLMKAHEELEKNNPFGKGDSKMDGKFLEFLRNLKECQDGLRPFTLILDDPADNCFVYNPFAPKDDPKIIIEAYERSKEQNDDLGISDMETDPEKYCTDKKIPVKERTFIMIKPDGVQRGQVGEIINKFEKKGFKLAAMKLCQPGRAIFEKHYQDLYKMKFFNALVDYAASGPVCCMVWEGDNAVKTGRKILGATKPFDSNPSTLRGDNCIDVGRNVIHGSDSTEAAQEEIDLWFKDDELVTWEDHGKKWVYE